MAATTSGGLVKTSFSLLPSQLDRLRVIARDRSTVWAKVSISDVAREAIETGLDSMSQDDNIGIDASANVEEDIEVPA